MTKRVTTTSKTSRRRRVKYNTGKWKDAEKRLFLIGLKQFGKGKWKEVGTVLTTRSPVQIKSHGQKLLLRVDRGENIFAEFGGLGDTLDSVSFEHQSSDETFAGESPSSQVSEPEEDASMMEDDPTNAALAEEDTINNTEKELATPNPTMKQLMEAVHRAPVKRPLPRLALANSIILHKKAHASTPIALPLKDTIQGPSASRREVKAAVALMSLSSLVHSEQSSKGHSPFFAISTSSAFERPNKRRTLRVVTCGSYEIACLKLPTESPARANMVTPSMP